MKQKSKKARCSRRKKKLSPKPKVVSLEDTLQNIFEHMDEQWESKSPQKVESPPSKVRTVSQSTQTDIDSEKESSFQNLELESCENAEDSDASERSVHSENNFLNGNISKENGTYISINKESLKEAFKLLSDIETKPEQKIKKSQNAQYKFRRTCQEGYHNMLDLVHWQSYAFVVRAIRNLILQRDWDNLKELLLLMLRQHKILKNYIKEITYLYFMINTDCIDPLKVEDYFLFCFSTYDTSRKSWREFDIWFKNCEY